MPQYDANELARESTRKRLSRIIESKPLIQGSLVESLRTCGKRGCRCYNEGPKHLATYLSVRQGNKRTMVYVPEEVLPYVKECVANHQHLQEALAIISRDCMEVLISKKRQRNKRTKT
jgi:hypothetical protein